MGPEESALFSQAVGALEQGRPAEAITSFEALADRGFVDATVSYDRGLAYAWRARIGQEVPGDLGRAAHGFEEARELASDATLTRDATTALGAVRNEVARRRSRDGLEAQVEQNPTFVRTTARIMSENSWATVAITLGVGLAIALFVRYSISATRARVGATIALVVCAPLLFFAASMAGVLREDRHNLHEAVVVTQSARPADAHGIAVPGGTPLPEGARVQVLEQVGALTHFRWGPVDAWVPTATLRPIARVE